MTLQILLPNWLIWVPELLQQLHRHCRFTRSHSRSGAGPLEVDTISVVQTQFLGCFFFLTVVKASVEVKKMEIEESSLGTDKLILIRPVALQ